MALGSESIPFTMPVEPANSSNNNGNSNGWGGDGAWWIIVLFLFMWGNGGWGNGWGNGNNAGTQGALTRADLCAEMNYGQLAGGVRGLSQGICDSTFALNNSINGLGINVMQGFNGVNQGLCNLGYNMQQGFNATQVAMMQGNNAMQMQLADCCCKTNNNIERGFADVGYRMATDTCAVTTAIANSTRDSIDNQNANARAILDALTAQRIEAKDERIAAQAAQIQALQLSASQAQQNAAIGAMISASEATILRRTGAECPTPAYVVQPPTPVNFPTNCCGQFSGWNSGGCNSGCGC